MKKEKPEYQSLGELIATMREVVHREYFSGIKETVLMDSIELWMKEAARVAKAEIAIKNYGCEACRDSSKIGHTCV